MIVSLRQPCRLGSARKDGKSTIGQVGDEACEVARLRADQEIADEQRVPGEFGEDARLDARRGIGDGVEVLREELAAPGVGDEVGEQAIELVRRYCAVVIPPDRLIGQVVANDELVLRAAPGMHAGLGHQRALGGDLGFEALERLPVELRRLEVPMDGLEVFETQAVGSISRVVASRLVHLEILRRALAGVLCLGQAKLAKIAPAPRSGARRERGDAAVNGIVGMRARPPGGAPRA